MILRPLSNCYDDPNSLSAIAALRIRNLLANFIPPIDLQQKFFYPHLCLAFRRWVDCSHKSVAHGISSSTALILLWNGFVLSDVPAGRPASIGRKIHRSAIAKNRMHRHGGERWTYTPSMYKLRPKPNVYRSRQAFIS